MQTLKTTIQNEWNELLESGRMPYFEYELNNGEYLLVELELNNNGLLFMFDDMGLNCYFDGSIINNNLMPYSEMPYYNINNINDLLVFIDTNMNGGFIYPNDLMPVTE